MANTKYLTAKKLYKPILIYLALLPFQQSMSLIKKFPHNNVCITDWYKVSIPKILFYFKKKNCMENIKIM